MPLEAESARKLDVLGDQLGAVLVQMATLTATVGGVREDIARQGNGHADHEARLRGLEANGCAQHSARLNRHGERLDALEQWRWKTAGVIAVCTFIGGGGGAGIAAFIFHR